MYNKLHITFLFLRYL